MGWYLPIDSKSGRPQQTCVLVSSSPNSSYPIPMPELFRQWPGSIVEFASHCRAHLAGLDSQAGTSAFAESARGTATYESTANRQKEPIGYLPSRFPARDASVGDC